MMDAITLLTVSGLAVALIGSGLYEFAYQRGRSAGISYVVEWHEPESKKRQDMLDDMISTIQRQRIEHEARWQDATSMIEHLQQQVDARAALQDEHRTELQRAANLLSLAARTWTALGATDEARNGLTCAAKLRGIADTLHADDLQPAPPLASANPKICDCPENGGCTEPCVRIEQPA